MKHGADAPDSDGAHKLDGEPDGPRMGRIHAGRGHLTAAAGAIRLPYLGRGAERCPVPDDWRPPLTIERWAEICETGEE